MDEKIQPDYSTIQEIVQKATQIPDLIIGSWKTEKLSVQGRRTVFRISGIGQSNQKPYPWSAILKQIKAPKEPAPDTAFEHVAYWEREYLMYEAGIPQSLQGELRSPDVYATQQPDSSLRWIWMEDLTDTYQGKWPIEFFAKTAYHLGLFNGQYLTGERTVGLKLIAKDALQQRSEWNIEDYQHYREPGNWKHPLVRKAYPRSVLPKLDQLLVDRNKYLEVIKQFPHSLCHLDAWHGNIAAEKEENGNISPVLFDWALVGYGAPGREISNMVWSAPLELVFDIEEIDRLEYDIFYQYLQGLSDAGWQPDVDQVRIAYLISSVLLFGFSLESIDHALNEEWYGWDEEQYGVPIEDIVCKTAQVTYRLFERIDELNALLTK